MRAKHGRGTEEGEKIGKAETHEPEDTYRNEAVGERKVEQGEGEREREQELVEEYD